jgi:DNA-binding response OmpR family regulator
MDRLLVVDDEPSMRRVLTRELCEDYEVVLARGLDEALACIESVNGLTAVVTDLMLGRGPDGLRLLAEVRERRPECVRVLVSSTADRLELARQSGIAHVAILKPWAPREVLRCVRALKGAPGAVAQR